MFINDVQPLVKKQEDLDIYEKFGTEKKVP